MEIQIAVAKSTRFGSPESGDTLEVIERPNGGVSIVMCDGLTSGREAKTISGMVVRKVLGLLADGIRDGAAARAASDYLYMERHGQFPVFLNILSADLQTDTLVLTRNNSTPIFVAHDDQVECLAGTSQPIGTTRNIRPTISELTLKAGTTIVMYTDGLANAGLSQGGVGIDICTSLEAILEEQNPSAQLIADSILSQAIQLDHGHPNDDMSVAVLRVMGQEIDQIRRLVVRLPFNKADQEP